MLIVLFIVGLIIATILINNLQQLFMRVLNINVMAFSIKKKIIAIIIVAFMLTGIAMEIFGIK